MKKARKSVGLLISAAMLLSNVSAATVFCGDNNSDLAKEAIYSDSVRIYGNGNYRTNYEWPGTATLRNASYPGCLLEANSWSISEVFGDECTDLLYTDYKTIGDKAAYMKDGDRLLTNYEMAQWNGFLFVLTGGSKTSLVSKSYTDAEGKKHTYDVAVRNGSTGTDSYLYVFDISKGENYKKARYAKWSAAELGLQKGNPYQYMEGIAVDDNCIYIVTNEGANGVNSRARGLIVLENNVKRGNDATVPKRIDEQTDGYISGAKNIVPTSMVITGRNFETLAADGYVVNWTDGEIDLANTTSKKNAAALRITKVGKKIEDTKACYANAAYLTESDSIGVSLDTLLSSKVASWCDTTSPIVRDISADKNELTFLVTYSYGEKYYKEIFVTDWSNAESPVLLGSFAHEDTAVAQDKAPNFTAKCYTYEGYIYVSSKYGIDSVKKYDEWNNVSLSYKGKLNLGESEYVLRLAVVGDYMLAYVNINQNKGIEIKAKLSEDKCAVEKYTKISSAPRRSERVLTCGGRIYTQWEYSQVEDAARQSCIYVSDTNKIMPVSLSVENPKDSVIVPYVIKGTGINLDAVSVTVNGEDKGYVKAKNKGNGQSEWAYTVTESGDYKITFTGASLEGYPIKETSESVDFSAYTKDGVTMAATYTENDGAATVNITVTNSSPVSISAMPIGCLYSQNTMEKIVFGGKEGIDAGESKNFEITIPISEAVTDYRIKAFLIDDFKTIIPLTEAVEVSK